MAERSRVVKAGSKVSLALASDEWLVGCVRRGDTAAFEALYDRHVRELLAFCVYMLGSRQDAEDAVQATFTSAYRALRADTRQITLRPWLFTIARNDCLTILRRRRPVVELNGEIAPGPDPVAELEVREEVRKVFAGLRELPENQRAALVLAEVHGLSQQEIGGVLGVRTDQVKAYVYQARSKLISDRRARDADCEEIREELASARGAALLRGRLRRHVRSCPECRRFADGMARQRRHLGALLPIAPSLALKYRAIEEAMNAGAGEPATVAGGAAVGASVAGTAAEVAGGGMKVLACKVAAGMVCLGAGAGVGVSALESPPGSQQGTTAAASAAALASAEEPGAGNGWSATLPSFAGGIDGPQRYAGSTHQDATTDSGLPVVENGGVALPGAEPDKPAGGSGEDPGAHGDPGDTGQGSQQHPGRPLREGTGNPASKRETKVLNSQQRVRLRRQSNEREAQQRRLAHEAPKPPRTGSEPPSEQEMAEKHERRKLKLEERGPEGHSKFPRETPEEHAEKLERHRRKVEEKRKRKQEEEQRAAGGEGAPGS